LRAGKALLADFIGVNMIFFNDPQQS
jgi:hypothetical protein